LCLLVARERSADRVDASDLGGSRGDSEKEERETVNLPRRANARPGREVGGPFRGGRNSEAEAAEEVEALRPSTSHPDPAKRGEGSHVGAFSPQRYR
jgi:hypothetical protein